MYRSVKLQNVTIAINVSNLLFSQTLQLRGERLSANKGIISLSAQCVLDDSDGYKDALCCSVYYYDGSGGQRLGSSTR